PVVGQPGTQATVREREEHQVAAIGTTRAQQLIAAAAEVGMTPAELGEISGRGEDWLEMMSHTDECRCEQEIERRRRRAAAAARATERQVAYLVKLLARARRSGEGGGFISTRGLYTADGNVNIDALRQLTVRQASNLIDSLKGSY